MPISADATIVNAVIPHANAIAKLHQSRIILSPNAANKQIHERENDQSE
jgi:hypothetical protein